MEKKMTEPKRKKTNIQIQVDSEYWDRLNGLAKFLNVDRNELLNEAIKDLLDKKKGKK